MKDPGVMFDADALREKYARERDRRLRPDGIAQYVEIAGPFAGFAEDPWSDPHFTRDPLRDEVDVAIVGAGFGGLLTGARLRELGVQNIRLIDKAADVGGTWYWNRYPGIACDVESYVYMPLLEELGYIPTEKYAKGDEIFAHCRRIAEHYDLYRDACLQTEVTRNMLGRRAFPMDHHHQPRRRDPGAVRLDGQRIPAEAETSRHRRDHGLPRARLPHQPVGLRLHRRRPGQAGGQAGRDHRHWRDRDPVCAAPRQVGGTPVRVPAHAVDGGCARQPADRSRMVGGPEKRVGSVTASRTSSCSPRAARPMRTWSTTPGRASSRSCS